MPLYEIEIKIYGTVQVEAESPEAANEKVMGDWSQDDVLAVASHYHVAWDTERESLREIPANLRITI